MMESDPVGLFQHAVAALNGEDWAAVARLCDPTSLRVFKRQLLGGLTPANEQTPRLTATELMKAVPGMPRAVAEYQVGRFRETLDPRTRLRDELPSVRSRQELEAMEPADVFAAWLDGRSLRRQIERSVERRRMSRATANEVIALGLNRFIFRALGVVDDGPRIVHIIYRRDDGAANAAIESDAPSGEVDPEVRALWHDLAGRERTSAITARRQDDDGWLLVANTDFLHVDQTDLPLEDDVSAADA